MSDLGAVLAAFHGATGREAAIWERRNGAHASTLLACTSQRFAERTNACATEPDVCSWAAQRQLVAHAVTLGEHHAWVVSECADIPASDRLLVDMIKLVNRLARERDGATRELAERYEEISLLYTIGEMLGSSTSVESVAGILLRELAITVGASRAAFLIVDPADGSLQSVATLGIVGKHYPRIQAGDPHHIAARAFREAHAVGAEGDSARAADPILAADGGAVLAAAITRANASEEDDTTPLGVVVLAGKGSRAQFTAGDHKLVTAVATQVGTALHNTRLVRAAVEREQFARELQLAHDLQLKLLPDARVVAPEARAAARVVQAESVGGDFYLLTRLDAHRTGIMIGDVAGHGYQAALVMALALSAAAIHVQAAADPAATVNAVNDSIADELASTEMSLSLCYAVIDTEHNELRYANAGHPHAFRLDAEGNAVRLAAVAPPLGLGDGPIVGGMLRWNAGDRVLMFTDGLADARDPLDKRLGEAAVLAEARDAQITHAQTQQIVDRLFARVDAHAKGVPFRDDLAVVVVERLR